MTIQVEKKEHVTTIMINRPDVRNAVDGPTGEALADAFRAFEADEQARVAVLCGAEGNFCAGADLKAIARTSEAALPPYRLAEDGDGPMGPSRMLLSKPVIAAVAGYAVAGGLELALWCDMRVMEQSATFGVFCRRWGVPLVDGGTVRLPRLIGMSRALDLILTGRPVGSEEALMMGLANRIVEDGQARQAAESMATEIAQFPQACMLHDRQSAFEQQTLPLNEALLNEFRLGMKTLDTKESVKGAQKFSGGAGRHGVFEE